MSIVYSTVAINYRLEGVIDAIDSGATNGYLLIREGATTLVTIQLNRPCGTVNGGILTFSGTLQDNSADATGTADNAVILNGDLANMVTGLTVGTPSGTQDVIISNGLNSTVITAGQTVELLSAQITGS